MSAENTLPSYSNRSPPRMPRTISTESRMCARGFVTFGGPPCFVLLRKIFEVPKPTMKRPGPGRLLDDARVHRDLDGVAV